MRMWDISPQGKQRGSLMIHRSGNPLMAVRLPVAGDFEQLPVIQDSLAIAHSLDLGGKRRLRLADCREEAFLMLSLERSPTLRQHALRLCAKYGFSPRVVQEAHELPTLFALARPRSRDCGCPHLCMQGRD
jgi:hypothetical protein